jgi:predicted flap endonuclease-1-like 5' DNA nuclease
VSSDDEKAMRMVIDGMGEAARAAKIRKYTPKPAPAAEPAEQPAAEEAEAAPSIDDLARMIGD